MMVTFEACVVFLRASLSLRSLGKHPSRNHFTASDTNQIKFFNAICQ